MSSIDAAAKTWFEDFARDGESGEGLDLLVRMVDDRIAEALPEFLDPILRAELDASTRAHWKGFLAVLGREILEVQVAPQIHDLARTLARRGYGLPLLLSVYRVGQRAVWEYITETLQTDVPDPALRATVLAQFWSRVSDWLDTIVEALIVTFTDERDQWQRGAVARREAAVDAILAGHAVDLDATIATLGYPLRQYHRAFTVSIDELVPEAEAHRLIDSVARTISDACGGFGPLVVSRGSRASCCWTATPAPGPPLGDDLKDQLPDTARVTIGLSHSGLSGFQLSHNEAVAAMTVTEHRKTKITQFQDVEIACLASGIMDSASRRSFLFRELQGLADSDDATERLRETLQVYLRLGGDATETGSQLRLHPNTVRYRIRQAEKKLGHPVHQRRLQIELALAMIGVPGWLDTSLTDR